MSNGRGSRRNVDTGREPGAFITIPRSVLESAAYQSLSANARSLLLEVALQCHGDDNGRLLLSRAFLAGRGFSSSDMIFRGKAELLAASLIFETVKGHRPNKASWFAITWRNLNKSPNYDHGAEAAFERGSYRRTPQRKNAALSPPHGPKGVLIGPPHGTESASHSPSCGPMRATLSASPGPYVGHPLEKPSVGVTSKPAGMSTLLLRARLQPSQRPPGYAEARARHPSFTH